MAGQGNFKSWPRKPSALLFDSSEENEKGRGAYGRVYSGTLDGRPVAVKTIHLILLQHPPNDRLLADFEKECQILRSLSHRHIVKLLGNFREKGDRPILVMELCEENLSQHLERCKEHLSRSLSCQLEISREITEGLHFLHEHNIVHRDLKLENILIGKDGCVRIGDFGQSKLVSHIGQDMSTQQPGTAIYMPPEALKEEDVSYDAKIDVFSLGVVFTCIATQREPRVGLYGIGQKPELKRRVQDLQPLTQPGAEHHPLQALIYVCLQDNPEFRPDVVMIRNHLHLLIHGTNEPQLQGNLEATEQERNKLEEESKELCKHIQTLTKDVKMLTEELDEARKGIAEQLEAKHAMEQNLKLQLKDKDASLQECSKELEEKDSQLVKHEKKQEELKKIIFDLERTSREEQEKSEAESKELRKQIQTLEKNVQALTEELHDARKEIAEQLKAKHAMEQNLQLQLKERDASLQECSKELKDKDRQLLNHEKEQKELKKIILDLERTSSEEQEKNKTLEKNVQVLTEELDNARKETAEQLKAKHAMEQNLTLQLKDKDASLEESIMELKEKDSQLLNCERERKELRKIITDLERTSTEEQEKSKIEVRELQTIVAKFEDTLRQMNRMISMKVVDLTDQTKKTPPTTQEKTPPTTQEKTPPTTKDKTSPISGQNMPPTFVQHTAAGNARNQHQIPLGSDFTSALGTNQQEPSYITLTHYVKVSGLQAAITMEDIVQYFESQQWQGCKVVNVIYMGIHKSLAMVGVQGVSPETLNNLSCKTHVIHRMKVKVELTDMSPTPEQIASAAYSDNPNSVTSATVSEDSKEVISVTSDQISPPSVDTDKLSSSAAESKQLKKNSSNKKSQCSESSHSSETFSKTAQGPCVQPVQLTGVKEQDSREGCNSHYITVSGLPSSITVEDIVAYFQSARCGGGTVTKVVYLDKEKSVIIVGFSDIALTSSHKLFKGIHRIAGTKATVKATDTALTPEQKQSAVYSYDCKPASTDSDQVKSPSGRTIQKDMPIHLEHDQTKVCSSACKTLPTSNAPKYFDGSSQQETSYIAVTGLTQCMSVEDIVAYFQSARCGGGTVTKLAYVDQSKSVAFVGISGLKLNSSHKLFKGKHVLNHRQVNVCLATNPLPPRENSDLVAYVHKETNPLEGMLPNSSTTHANVMAVPNAHTPETIPVQGPLHKYLLASQCQDVAPQELEENKHAQFINPPSNLHVSHNMSDTPTQGNNDGIDSEVTITAPKGTGANLHAAITAHKAYTDVTVTLSSEGNLVLRGRKKGVEKLKIEVKRMIHDNTIANTATVTVQSQSLPPQVLVYIEKCVRERMMNTYNIQFKTDIQTNTLEVFGTSASCTHFMNAVQSFNPNCVDVTLPAEGVSLLASPQGMAVIRNVIGQRPIGHLFTGTGGSVACSVAEASKLHLVAEKYEDLVYIAQQLQNNIVVHEYPVSKQFFNLPSSSSWTNVCQALETNFTAQLSSHADKGIVTIACDKQHLENVKKGLREFCEKEGICKEVLTLQKKEWEHLKHFRDWTNLTAKMNSSGLQVQLPSSWDQTPTISFQGEVAAVRYYTQRTKEIIDNIARQTRDTSRLANTQLYKSVSGRQPGMGSTNHNTADCQITLDKRSDKSDPGNHPAHPVLDLSTTGQNVGNVQPSKEHTLATKTMDATSIIEMKRGSLTDYQADVYVNTAHNTLNLKHGAVAKSLLKAGGAALQAECDGYIAKHGYIPEWGYAVTGGGELKCKCIIHAVAAFYGGRRGSASTEQAMKTMVANIMAECDRLQVSSVAFPAIGTGMLGFPDNIVAKVMLQAIYSYLQTHLHSTLKRVFLVIFSDKTYKAFQSQFQTTLSCTQGATSLLQSSTQPSHHISSHTVAPPQPVYHSAHSSTAPTQVQSATLQSFVSNNVTIDIIHGDITSEDCDGIVSTSSCDLTLRNFGVMGALLKKGGTELQQECTAAVQRYGHLHSSKVIVTGTGRPGGLKCRRILHILAPYYVANDLQKVVKAVLREADKERLSVVSLPAIGTGKHGFSPRVAAEGICEAIVEFSKSQPKHVKYVKVVLFQEEHYSSFSTAFTAASSKKGLSPSRNALSHVCSAITPGHGTSSANSETPTVQRPPYILPSHAKPQQTGHTQNAARSPADSKQPQVQLKEGETSKNDHSSANAKTEEANVVKKKHFASMTPDGSRNTLTDSMTAVQDTSLPTVQIKRQNFMQEEDTPSTWDRMPTDPLTGKEDTYHLVDLPQHSVEYKEVSQVFHQTISYYKIKKIQRIQNPKLWSQYAARKKTMDRENPHGIQNERKLFHGCAEGSMQSINHSGFNASNAGRKASTYGKGMYFTRDASSSSVYAASCQGSRHMYLARVLTGEFTTGNYTTSIPPPKNLSNPNVLFDSVVDSIHYPCVFVVFFEDQAYPEYLITYSI